MSSRASAPRSAGGAGHRHPAGCQQGHGPPMSTRLVQGCCGEWEKKHKEKPHREAPKFPHTAKGWVLRGAHVFCWLCPTPSSSGMAMGGTIPAAASQEVPPGITTATCRPAGPSMPGPKLKPSPTSHSSHSKRLSRPHHCTAAPAPSPADSRVSALRGTARLEQQQNRPN